MITIGIDPHKSSHTAVALDPAGWVLGEIRVPATKAMSERLLRWAVRWPAFFGCKDEAPSFAIGRQS